MYLIDNARGEELKEIIQKLGAKRAQKWLSFPIIYYCTGGYCEPFIEKGIVDYGYPLEYCLDVGQGNIFHIIWNTLEKGKKLHLEQCSEELKKSTVFLLGLKRAVCCIRL